MIHDVTKSPRPIQLVSNYAAVTIIIIILYMWPISSVADGWLTARSLTDTRPTPLEACKNVWHVNGLEFAFIEPNFVNGRWDGHSYTCVHRMAGRQTLVRYLWTSLACDTGFPTWPGVCLPYRRPMRVSASCDPNNAGHTQGNPVLVGTGAKVQTETDISWGPHALQKIQRTYSSDSQSVQAPSIGYAWSICLFDL